MGKRAGQFLAETIASIKPRVCVTIQQRMRFFLYLYTNTHTHCNRTPPEKKTKGKSE